MLQKSSKTVLIAGFLIGFIIMLLLTIGSSHIGKAHTRQLQAISGENTHAFYLTQMRDAALKRTNLLLQMILSDDIFQRDELFLKMKNEAVQFILARDKFLALPDITTYEVTTWEQVAKIIATNSSVQNEAATYLIEGNDQLARDALNSQILEANSTILDILNGILIYQGVEINNLIESTIEQRDTTNMYLNILAFVGVGSFLFVAFVVYRLVTDNEEKIRKASLTAHNANHAKSAFLANMSHEIRTPLTAILGFSEQLSENKSLDNDCYEAVTHIKSNCDHLRNMVNDILDLSKIEAGQLIIEYQNLSLNPFLENTLATFYQQARQKGLEFELAMEFPIPLTIKTDEIRLKQILINLINNAIKFTHQGKVTIGMRFNETNNHLYFSISDTGIGIESEYLQQLFVPYSQANSKNSQQYGGTGLGLAISRQLIERLDGKLEVESTPGQGSTFSFYIATGDNTDRRLISSQTELDHINAPEISFTNLIPKINARILLAEDNRVNQILISKLIRRTGAEVDIANNGQEVLAAVRKNEYDLIVMDIKMPNMDGIEATEALRQEGFTIPIIALTANALIEDRNTCLAAGMNAYLTKPVEKEKFYQTLLKLTA